LGRISRRPPRGLGQPDLTDVIAREIVEDLTAALAEFETGAAALEAQLPHATTVDLPGAR
jgi:hypothetical protein